MADDSNPQLHLLTLPTELRLRIYELAFSAAFVSNKLTWEPEGYTFSLWTGAKTYGTPWTLLRVCKQLRDELHGMLPLISDIKFHFHEVSEADMRAWLDRMSDGQVSQIRRLSFSGSGECQQRHDGSRCERGLHVTLPPSHAIIQSDKGRYDRTMSGAASAHTDRLNKQFYKGFYLLRVRDDVVKIPKAASHPRGSIGQCNSVVDQQRAIAGFVTDEGEVRCEKEALVELLRAVMTDEIPGGPGTGRRWPAAVVAVR